MIMSLGQYHSLPRLLVSRILSTSHAVMRNTDLSRVQTRIGELKKEGDDAKQSFRSLNREKGTLEKEVETKKMNMKDWEEKCVDLQMLKFGRVVDLEYIDSMSDKTLEVEAEAKANTIEQEQKRIVAIKQVELRRAEDELEASTADNTMLLDALANILQKKVDVEGDLRRMGAKIGADAELVLRREEEDRQQLADFVTSQARELEALKSEIMMLRRKETLLYAQPLPPVPHHAGGGRAAATGLLPPIPVNRAHAPQVKMSSTGPPMGGWTEGR